MFGLHIFLLLFSTLCWTKFLRDASSSLLSSSFHYLPSTKITQQVSSVGTYAHIHDEFVIKLLFYRVYKTARLLPTAAKSSRISTPRLWKTLFYTWELNYFPSYFFLLHLTSTFPVPRYIGAIQELGYLYSLFANSMIKSETMKVCVSYNSFQCYLVIWLHLHVMFISWLGSYNSQDFSASY